MLGKAEEGEPFALTVADESIHLCLLEEGEKPGRILQIVGDNMTKRWGDSGGLFGMILCLFFDTSRGVAEARCCVRARRECWGHVRLWSGFLVLKLLQGFPVFLKGGW